MPAFLQSKKSTTVLFALLVFIILCAVLWYANPRFVQKPTETDGDSEEERCPGDGGKQCVHAPIHGVGWESIQDPSIKIL